MKKILFFILFIAILSCKKDNNETNTRLPIEHFEWVGTYQGYLPCDGCGDIKTMITLHDNNYFDLMKKYDDGNELLFQGNFIWDKDDQSIILEGLDNQNRFLVLEGKLHLLDNNGKKLDPDFSEKYALRF